MNTVKHGNCEMANEEHLKVAIGAVNKYSIGTKMTNTSTSYKCNKCQKPLKEAQKVCPDCNSKIIDINIHVSEKITVRDFFGLKRRAKGIKKFLSHTKGGRTDSGDKAKHPEGVQLEQTVDRQNNLYKKKVIDEKTGKVVKDLEEPLDEHH